MLRNFLPKRVLVVEMTKTLPKFVDGGITKKGVDASEPISVISISVKKRKTFYLLLTRERVLLG